MFIMGVTTAGGRAVGGCTWLFVAAGDGDDCIKVFGQGDPDLVAALLAAPPTPPPAAQAGAAAMDVDGGGGGGTARGAAQAGAATVPGGGEEAGVQQQGQGAGCGAVAVAWSLWCDRPKAHSADVNCLRWHPSDPWLLASCGDDAMVRLWRVRPQQL